MTTMTALEMATKFKWASVMVSLGYETVHLGHVMVDGQTRIIGEPGQNGSAVWVGQLALSFEAIVEVEPIGTEGAKVRVSRFNQKAA